MRVNRRTILLVALAPCLALALARCGKTSTVTTQPAVTAIAPSSDKTSGGTKVTLTGTGFINGATVSLGGFDCGNVAFVSTTSLTCTTPAFTPATLTAAVDVVVTNPNLQIGTLSGGFTFNAPEIAAFDFLDGNDPTKGINVSSSQNASAPQFVTFNGKLYATWQEPNGTATQIRVAVFNGNTESPQWTHVEGKSGNGINVSASQNGGLPQLAVLGNGLYAIWLESNGTATQVRVAAYNTDDAAPVWTSVDNGTSGLNKDATKNASTPYLAVVNGTLYATWAETNGTAVQIRVSAFNGSNESPGWTRIDGAGTNGINRTATKDGATPTLAGVGSKVYAFWSENNGTATEIRAAVYNPTATTPSFAFVDGADATNGLNKDNARSAQFPAPAILNGTLYLAWQEANGTATQIRVVSYGGTDTAPKWTFIDGNGTNGLNKDPSLNATTPVPYAFNGKLYLAWSEFNASPKSQIRLAVWGGTRRNPRPNPRGRAFTFVDGGATVGINRVAAHDAFTPQLVSFLSRLCVIFSENDGNFQIRVEAGR